MWGHAAHGGRSTRGAPPLSNVDHARDGTISLETACEGEHLAGRLETHFARDEIALPFSEPDGKWSTFKARKPGDLHLTTEKLAGIKVRYERGDPEFFAALMTSVDHQFNVDVDVEPKPVLAAPSLNL